MSENKLTGSLGVRNEINVDIIGTGARGKEGKSAYEIWLDLGNEGTEQEYLASLKGQDGYTPIKGKDYFDGEKGIQGVPGLNGKSLEFLWNDTQLGIRIEGESTYQYVNLKGDTGPKGDTGDQGIQGEIGPKGDTGDNESLDAQLITDALGYIPLPISNGVLENYREKLVTLSGTSTAINLSLGNVFTHTLTGNTIYSITNAVNSQAHSFTLIITQTATVRTITFPASVKWQGGKIPDMSTPLKEYELFFTTTQGGGSWRAGLGGVY